MRGARKRAAGSVQARRRCRMIRRRTLFAGGAGALAALAWRTSMDARADSFEVTHSEEEWRRRLTPVAFEVLRRHGTEPAGSSPLNREKRKGLFACAGCEQPLFSS